MYGIKGTNRELIDETPLAADLPPASSVEYSVSSTVAEIGDQLEVVVDEDGALPECSSSDDTFDWTAMPCG